MAKFYANLSILVLAAFLGGCGNQAGAPGEENEIAEISDAELISDTKALNEEEVNLEKVGLKFEIVQEGANQKCRWNIGFQKAFEKAHPEIKIDHMVPALERYIKRNMTYLTKYERFRTGNSVYTLTHKAELEAKQGVAKDTRDALWEEINKRKSAHEERERIEKAAKEKADREKREQEARDSLLPNYTGGEFSRETQALETESKKLEPKGIILLLPSYIRKNTELSWTLFRYYDEQVKTRSSREVKAELILDIQKVIDLHSKYISKYEAYPYRITTHEGTWKIDDAENDVFRRHVFKIDHHLALAKSKIAALYQAIERIDRR